MFIDKQNKDNVLVIQISLNGIVAITCIVQIYRLHHSERKRKVSINDGRDGTERKSITFYNWILICPLFISAGAFVAVNIPR